MSKSYIWPIYGRKSIQELVDMIEERDKLIDLADRMIEQVLPQAGGIVLDIGVANELCMGITKIKQERRSPVNPKMLWRKP